jgi:hypothetical protein
MKEKNIKKRKIALFAVFTLILILNFVSATNIGISPAKIYFKDVLRGGYSEKFVIITIDSPDPVDVKIQTRGNISEWLSFNQTEFEVSKDKPFYLKVMAMPPEDIPNGNYSGFLRVTTSGNGNSVEGQATGIVNAALDLYVEIEITDIEIISCNVNQFNVESAEKGDSIKFSADIYNNGNIRLKPHLRVEIWDENQIEIVKEQEFIGKEIIPTTNEKIIFEVDSSDLYLGQYWAEVYSVDCYNSQTLTFDVLEEGALKAQGSLTKIIALPWVEKDETTSIQAYFENTGEKTVEAMFKGEITYNGKIVQILESEKHSVSIGESDEFNFYFTPKEIGKYILTGRVFYDGKRTFEKSTIINVKDAGFDINKLKMPAIYLALLTLIAFLLYKIKKEKEGYGIKLRRKNE